MVIHEAEIEFICKFHLLTQILLSRLIDHSIGTSGTNKVMNGNRFISHTRPPLIRVSSFPAIHT
jgi:hypothetical protein